MLADYIMRTEKQYKGKKIEYDKIVHDLEGV